MIRRRYSDAHGGWVDGIGILPFSASPTPSTKPGQLHWRTRRDPFAEVFDSEIVPLLALDDRRVLEARTLQRRLRDWRALHGPEQEVYFPQEHPPGREAAFDFTNCNDLGVTIDRSNI